MAYANLVNIPCANRAEVFKRFRDFVCKRNGSYDYSTTGIGWTLHDSFYAVNQDTISTNDYFVIKSVGESGNEDLYFKVAYVANYISISGYLYWNNSTHVGVQLYGGTNNWSISDTDVPILWIYGNLNAVYGISRQNSGSILYYPAFFGMLTDSLYDPTVVTSTAAITAGSSVVIDVGTVPATWRVGDRLFIRDLTRIDRTAAVITAKSASTVTITVAYSYNAGAKLSQEMPYFVNNGFSFNSGVAVLVDHAGTKGAGFSGVTASPYLLSAAPDPLNSEHVLDQVGCASLASGFIGYFPHVWIRQSTPLVNLDLHQLTDGTNVRVFTLYSSNYVVIKEV